MTSPRRSHESKHSSASQQRYDEDSASGKEKGDPRKRLRDTAKKLWTKTELDTQSVLLMIKGGIPPTISLAMYQSDSVAREYSTLGYLIAIISILGFAIMPRAKFLQMIVYDAFVVCLGSAIALLMMYSCVKARERTAPPGVPISTYNSSASAVSGVFLFFQIYLVHSMRAKFPQFQLPVIIYSIFANVASVYAMQMATMSAAMSFVEKMLKSFLTGLAIAFGVSLFIFPMTSRKVVFKEMSGYIGALRKALDAEAVYIESLERNDMFGRTKTFDSTIERITTKGNKSYSPEADKVLGSIEQINTIHGKLHADITFAKREFAIGYLGADDLNTISKHLRLIMVPVVGISFVVDIFQRLSEFNRWNEPIDIEEAARIPDDVRMQVVMQWNDLMRAVHAPFQMMIRTIDEGLLHATYVLKLCKPPKKKTESSEEEATDSQPGEKGFADYFERRMAEFSEAKRIALRTWCEAREIQLPADFFENPATFDDSSENDPLKRPTSGRSRRQLYMFIFMEQLVLSTARSVLGFVKFADERRESGKLARKHVVIPGGKRMRKWVLSTFKVQDSNADDNMADMNTKNAGFELGEAYSLRKDPEHLPPETTFEHIGEKVRAVPSMLRSPESIYGFRVACATMSIFIIGILHDSQSFFVQHRLFWALIMVSISMSTTAGQTIFGFFLRILGTVAAMICSWLIWYIPDQRTAGVIVLLFVFASCGYYIPIKKFHLRVVGMISIVTTTMMVGYELQVRKIGEAAATSNGQIFYPIYLLAPYRLAAVAGGIAVAFIWTFFPYPMSEHSALRQTLGSSLYLLANYYSIVHETVFARMSGQEGDALNKSSAGRRLEKARHTVFSKQMLMIDGMRTYAGFLKWEVPIGGRFPKERYNAILPCVQNISNYLSVMSYASDMLLSHLKDGISDSNLLWVEDFKKLVYTARRMTHDVTSLLCLLSASIAGRQPLPPYLKAPRPYSFDRQLEEIDKNILSIRHMYEPGFAAFSVLQISGRCIVGDVNRLLK